MNPSVSILCMMTDSIILYAYICSDMSTCMFVGVMEQIPRPLADYHAIGEGTHIMMSICNMKTWSQISPSSNLMAKL